MPEKGTMLKFKNYHRGEKVPFVIYADFKSCIKSIHTCDLNPKSSYTKQYQKHEPISFYHYIKCFNSKVYLPIKERSYTGKNAEQVFLKYLEEDIKMIANIRFIRDLMMGVSAMRIIHMLKKYGGRLKWNILKTITNYIIKLMFYF